LTGGTVRHAREIKLCLAGFKAWSCYLRLSRRFLRGRTIFVADAHRGDGQRFVVRADENLTAFVEPESTIRSRENSP
jgi:hypothetical protein